MFLEKSGKSKSKKREGIRIPQELLEGKKAPAQRSPHPLSGEDQNPVKLTLADLQDCREDMDWC